MHARWGRLERLQVALGFLILAGLCGCATYPQRMAAVKMEISRNTASTNSFPTYSAKDALLEAQEKARYFQLLHQNQASFEAYCKAIELYEKQDEKAIVDLSDSARSFAASTLANDLAIPYSGSALERLLCYQNAVLTALALEQLEDAKIGVRNMSDWLSRYIERSFAEEAALLVMEEEGNNPALWQQRNLALQNYRQALQGTYAEQVKALRNPVANAASFALVGLLFEMQESYADAARAYVQASELAGNDEGFRALAKEMLRREGILKGGGSSTNAVETGATGEVVVFFENGYAPEKQETRIAFATALGAVTAAFPYYNPSYVQPATAMVFPADSLESIATTRTICDLQAHILRDFEDKKPGIFMRQVSRTVAKAVATGALEMARRNTSNSDTAAVLAMLSFASQIAAIASEQADLRSWLLLPSSYGYARFTLPIGTHTLRVASGMLTTTVEVDVHEDEITLLHGMSVPGRLLVQPVRFVK